MSETTTLLKAGATGLVLQMSETGAAAPAVSLDQPLRAFEEVSRDITGRSVLRLAGGRSVTALSVQREYLAQATDFAARQGTDAATALVLRLWQRTVDAIKAGTIDAIAREIDWAVKYRLTSSTGRTAACPCPRPRSPRPTWPTTTSAAATACTTSCSATARSRGPPVTSTSSRRKPCRHPATGRWDAEPVTEYLAESTGRVVRAVLFDVFGTVVDWRTGVAAAVRDFAAENGLTVEPGAFADAWRARYGPAMQRVTSGERSSTPLDVLHRSRSLGRSFPLSPTTCATTTGGPTSMSASSPAAGTTWPRNGQTTSRNSSRTTQPAGRLSEFHRGHRASPQRGGGLSQGQEGEVRSPGQPAPCPAVCLVAGLRTSRPGRALVGSPSR